MSVRSFTSGCRLFGRTRILFRARLEVLDEDRRANLFFVALFADNADKIRTRQLELARVTEMKELLEVFAGHVVLSKTQLR